MKFISQPTAIIFSILMILVGAWGLGNAETAKIDRAGFRSDASIIADYAHHEIHEGNHYFISNAATLSSGAATKVLFNTPSAADGVVHILFLARSSGEAHATIYEYATVSALGAPVTPVNRNRTSSNLSAMDTYFNPTITGLGNLINEAHFGAGQNIAGEVRSLNELVLKAETLYFLNTVSEAASNDVSLTADWYEDGGDAP